MLIYYIGYNIGKFSRKCLIIYVYFWNFFLKEKNFFWFVNFFGIREVEEVEMKEKIFNSFIISKGCKEYFLKMIYVYNNY